MGLTPQRIQLRRTKGWRKPEGAVSVARPSIWGNPFSIQAARAAGYEGTDADLRSMCVVTFRRWLRDPRSEWAFGEPQAKWMVAHLPDLAGRDLACWCPLDQPCHADVLLELANQ